jgi:hypothetical protein
MKVKNAARGYMARKISLSKNKPVRVLSEYVT